MRTRIVCIDREHRLLRAMASPERARPPEAAPSVPQEHPEDDGTARRELHQQTQRLVRHMQELRKTVAGARLNDLLQRQSDDVERAMRDLLDAQAGRERAANDRINAQLTRVYDAVAAAERTVLAAEQARANPLRFREERVPDGPTTFVFEIDGTDLNNRGPSVAITGELRWQERARTLVRRGRGYAEVLGEWQPRRQDYSDPIDTYFRPGQTVGSSIADGARLTATREVRDGRTVYRFTTPPHFVGALHVYTRHGAAHMGSSDAVEPAPAAPSVTVDRSLRERVQAETRANRAQEEHREGLPAQARAALDEVRSHIEQGRGAEGTEAQAALAQLNAALAGITPDDDRTAASAGLGLTGEGLTVIDRNNNDHAYRVIDRGGTVRIQDVTTASREEQARNAAERAERGDGAIRQLLEVIRGANQDVRAGSPAAATPEERIDALIDWVNRDAIPALRARFGADIGPHLPFTEVRVQGHPYLVVRFREGRYELADTDQEQAQAATKAFEEVLRGLPSFDGEDTEAGLQRRLDGINAALASLSPRAVVTFARQTGLGDGVEQTLLHRGAERITFVLRGRRIVVLAENEERDRAAAEAVRNALFEARRLAAETQPLRQVQEQVRLVNERLVQLSPRVHAAAVADMQRALGAAGTEFANPARNYRVRLFVESGSLREEHEALMPLEESVREMLALAGRGAPIEDIRSAAAGISWQITAFPEDQWPAIRTRIGLNGPVTVQNAEGTRGARFGLTSDGQITVTDTVAERRELVEERMEQIDQLLSQARRLAARHGAAAIDTLQDPGELSIRQTLARANTLIAQLNDPSLHAAIGERIGLGDPRAVVRVRDVVFAFSDGEIRVARQ